MADEKKDKPKEEKKPRNLGLILQIGFAVLNLAVMGLGLHWVYASTIGWDAPSITEEKLVDAKKAESASEVQTAGPLVYTMDKFTTNLAGEPKRSIRVEVNLEMLSKDGFEEVINNDNRAKARDRIVKLLNDQTFSEVESIQGKLFLKDKIASELNGILDKGVVKDVYFSEFVVQ